MFLKLFIFSGVVNPWTFVVLIAVQGCESPNSSGLRRLQVEDIVDTGSTLAELMNSVVKEGALSVECVALLNKQARRASAINAKYVGFEVSVCFEVIFQIPWNQISFSIKGCEVFFCSASHCNARKLYLSHNGCVQTTISFCYHMLSLEISESSCDCCSVQMNLLLGMG